MSHDQTWFGRRAISSGRLRAGGCAACVVRGSLPQRSAAGTSWISSTDRCRRQAVWPARARGRNTPQIAAPTGCVAVRPRSACWAGPGAVWAGPDRRGEPPVVGGRGLPSSPQACATEVASGVQRGVQPTRRDCLIPLDIFRSASEITVPCSLDTTLANCPRLASRTCRSRNMSSVR